MVYIYVRWFALKSEITGREKYVIPVAMKQYNSFVILNHNTYFTRRKEMATVKKFVIAVSTVMAAEIVVWLSNRMTKEKEAD
jgi:lysine/ornithine N-monooxygenase